jgi:hypothetical protein
VIFWPVTALVRKSYGAPLTLDPRSYRAYRQSKLGALAIVIAIALWSTTIGLMLSDLTKLTSQFDGFLYFTQALGIVGFIGGFVLILQNLNAVWAGQRRWPAKVWSIVLVLSGFFVIWVGFVFNLLRIGASY